MKSVGFKLICDILTLNQFANVFFGSYSPHFNKVGPETLKTPFTLFHLLLTPLWFLVPFDLQGFQYTKIQNFWFSTPKSVPVRESDIFFNFFKLHKKYSTYIRSRILHPLITNLSNTLDVLHVDFSLLGSTSRFL